MKLYYNVGAGSFTTSYCENAHARGPYNLPPNINLEWTTSVPILALITDKDHPVTPTNCQSTKRHRLPSCSLAGVLFLWPWWPTSLR